METSKVYQLLNGHIEEKDDSIKEDEHKIYHVRWEEREDKERGFRVFSIGQPSDQPTKCVLLLGVTGAGKTTAISGFLNSFFGVKFEDPFRLQVKEFTNGMETESQTDFITVYTIYYKKGMKHKYNLVLIDTPGLADTRGTQQACKITRYLEEFITSDFGIHDLHCLGLVAKAYINRDLECEKALLGEIMSLLGDFVPEITHIFATFAADKPTVDAVVRNAGVRYQSMFKFDNGILYTNPKTCDEEERFSVSYRWKRMSEQYETFFDALARASPLNLELIRERKLFHTCKINWKAEIKQLVTSVTELEINKYLHMQYEEQKVVNKDWKQMKRVSLPEGQRARNCPLCERTCPTLSYKNGDAASGATNISNKVIPALSAVSVLPIFTSIVPKAVRVLPMAAALVVHFIDKKKTQETEKNFQASVCGVNGCSHIIANHTEESFRLEESIDENMKELYNEAVSKLEDVTTKIMNDQQEILRCTTTISHITVELMNHTKKIEQLTGRYFVSIKDIKSDLEREIRLNEKNIIPQATKYISIVTEAMRELVSYDVEEILDQHELVKERLLENYTNFL